MSEDSNRLLSLDEIRSKYFQRPTASFLIINDLRAVPDDMDDGLVKLLQDKKFVLIFDRDGSRERVQIYADNKDNAIWHSRMASHRSQYYRCVFFGYGNPDRIRPVIDSLELFMKDVLLISGHRALTTEDGKEYSLSTSNSEGCG